MSEGARPEIGQATGSAAGDARRWRVFLSSTFRELASYRRTVDARARATGLDARVELVLLERTTARVLDAPALCRSEVERSDLVIVLLGDELGSRLSDRALSYTELEVEAAIDAQVPVLGFVLAPGAPHHLVDPEAAGWDRLPIDGLDLAPDARRQQDLRARVQAIVGTATGPDRALDSEDHVADAVLEAVTEWLDTSARPRRVVLPGRASVPFVGYDQEYQDLRRRCLAGWPTVVTGPPGAGKSTLVRALPGDPDVVRAHPAGAHQLVMAVDDSDDPQWWSGQVRGMLDAAGALPGAPALVTVAVTWVVAVGPGTAAADVEALVETVFDPLVPAEPSERRCTLVFEVAEPICAAAVCHALDMADDDSSRVTVRGWDPTTAVAYLRRRRGLHPAPCALCDELGTDLVRALDCNPVLLNACVHDLASWVVTRELHEHLRRVEQLPVARRAVAALWERVDNLGADAWLVLDHAAALLPKPFVFPEAAIVAGAGASIGEDQARVLLDALADRGWLEVAGAGPGLDGGTDGPGDLGPNRDDGDDGEDGWADSVDDGWYAPDADADALDGSPSGAPQSDQRWFAIHPLIAEVSRRRHATVASERRETTATRHTEHLWSWFDQQVDELLEASSYRTWQLLEAPTVQALLCQWFHLLVEVARCPPASGPTTTTVGPQEDTPANDTPTPSGALALARLYAKAMWWWGLYVPFELCDTLAALGARVALRQPEASPEWTRLVAVAAAIEHLHRAWPREGAPFMEQAPSSPGSWQRARRALTDLTGALAIGLTPDAEETIGAANRTPAEGRGDGQSADRSEPRRADAHHEVTMLVHALLAHAERGGLADLVHGRTRRTGAKDGVLPPAAITRSVDQHYVAALRLADTRRGGPDRWNAAWFAYERADAAIDAMVHRQLDDPRRPTGPTIFGPDEVAEALGWVEEAAARLEEHHAAGDLDLELLANIHRLAADVAWWAGDPLRCWQYAVRAVVHAYWFLIDPAGEPDRYTSTFYREHRWRAAGYLGDLDWHHGQAASVDAVPPTVQGGAMAPPGGPPIDGVDGVDTLVTVVARAYGRDPEVLRQAIDAWRRRRPIASWPTLQWELADLLFPVGLAEADVIGLDTGSRSLRRRFADEVRTTVAAARVELPDLGTTSDLKTPTEGPRRSGSTSQPVHRERPAEVGPEVELVTIDPIGGNQYLAQLYELMTAAFPPDELGGPWRSPPDPGDLPVVAAVDRAGDVVGGAVGEHYPDAGVVLLSYLVVDGARRGGGIGGALLDRARRTWSAASGLILAEIEDPRFHPPTPDQDPRRRIAFYARHGTLAIDGPYFQPRLRSTSHRVPHLLLCVLKADQAHLVGPDRLAAGPVHRFLVSYFATTEGPGTTDADVRCMLDHYRQATVPVVPIERFATIGIWHCSACRHPEAEGALDDTPG